MKYICLDGNILPEDQPALYVTNRSYRYGDAVFETMRVKSGSILLESFHFERLFDSLHRLGFDLPLFLTPPFLLKSVLLLCKKNDCLDAARVRLSVSRGNGNLSDPAQAQFLVECMAVNPGIELLNENGFIIEIYPEAIKHHDRFSDIKSANYLPYVMASRFAKLNSLDDALLLNTNNMVADASIANIFLVNNQKLYTPSLTQGCIAGVMRRWLIENYNAVETSVSIQDLLDADEVFLTNAVYGLRWVKLFREKTYSHTMISAIHDALSRSIWS